MVRPVNFKILLRQINSVRVAVGIGMGEISAIPEGIPGDINDCPIAIALSNGVTAYVGGSSIELRFPRSRTEDDLEAAVQSLRRAGFKHVHINWTFHSVIFDTTRTMANFINRFDDEEFTDLIKGYQN